MESTPGEDAVGMSEMIVKDLDYYLQLVDKAAAEFQRIDFSFERSSAMGEMLSNSIACYKGVIHERKSQSMCLTLLSYFKKLLPLLQQPPP